MKKIFLSFLLVILFPLIAEAPIYAFKQPLYSKVYVRITAYSPKQPREGHRNCIGKSAKNEHGVAVSRYLRDKYDIQNGDIIEFPDGEVRVVDDKPSKWAERKFDGKLVDQRFYQSLKSKPKTRAINRELRKFDLGWNWIKIYSK